MEQTQGLETEPTGQTRSTRAVAILAISVTAAFLFALPSLARLDPVLPAPRIPIWILIAMFAASELVTVHFRFRRDAHKLSLADIPQVVGLFLVSPLVLVVCHLVGSTFVLVVKNVRGVKLWFNMAAFFTQYMVSIAIFRAVLGGGDPLGPRGALAAMAGSVVALVFAQALISMAINLTGGTVSRQEQLGVLSVGLVVVCLGASLGFLTVTLAAIRLQSVWLVILPLLVMAIAYRAYADQRDERARLAVLHNLTLALHGARLIDDAVIATASGLREMFEVEAVHVMLDTDVSTGTIHRTSAVFGGRTDSMVPMPVPDSGMWPSVRQLGGSLILRDLRPTDLALEGMRFPRSAMVAPLIGSEGSLGVVVVGQPMSSVMSFTARDRQLLDTVAGRLVVSLENGRLEDSLAELKQLKEKLEGLIRSKDQFIAAVSHELRTPLTGILGLAQVLNSDGSNLEQSELAEFLAIISEQSEEMGGIIEDLLVAARADAGTLVVKTAPTDVMAAIVAILAQIHPETGHLIIGPPPSVEPILVDVDPLRFRQILRNLLNNAVRHGGCEIRVMIRASESNVQVVVADNGPGVEGEAEEKIFEPYGRGNPATAAPGSVGIGLSVSRRLARLMGGDVTYQHRSGWTEFVLEMPVRDTDELQVTLQLKDAEALG